MKQKLSYDIFIQCITVSVLNIPSTDKSLKTRTQDFLKSYFEISGYQVNDKNGKV